MDHKRPVNLDLGSMKFPPMAIASILHRISGLVLALLFPIMLCFLSASLHSAISFEQLQLAFSTPLYKGVLWVFSSALSYHLLAGIRHILLDLGMGETVRTGRQSAVLVIVLAVVSTLILGIWIW